MRRSRVALLAVSVAVVPLGPRTAFAQGPGQTQSADPAPALRSGMTFEIGAGISLLDVHATASGGDVTNEIGLSGINLGIGGFLWPGLALTFRITGLIASDGNQAVISGFLGPSTQIWVSDHVWLRAGAGLGFAFAPGDDGGQADGLALDTGIGYSWATHTRNSVNVSLEVIPTLVSDFVVSTSLLIGYQFL